MKVIRMFLFLKSNLILFILILLTSCSKNSNPVKKNNEIFLSKYSVKIDRAKKKHLKKANKSGIKYDKKTNEDLVDSSYYRNRNGRKQIEDDILNNEIRLDENNKEPIYIGDDLSIYYRNRTLKDSYENLGYELYDNDEKLRYLTENKIDYSEVKTDFNSIEPTNEKLYGELKLRRDFYSIVGADVLLKNYDYLYVMDTVKKEIELKNMLDKEDENIKEKKKESNTKKVFDSLKEKFLNLLNGD